MKIAAAQIAVRRDVKTNLKTLLINIEKAATSGCDTVCFPEVCLINDERDAQKITKELDIIGAQAKTSSINVIFGSYELVEKKIKNRIYVVGRQGDIIHRYSKRNPYLTEKESVSPGRNNKVFLLDGVPCGVINCWDYAFVEDIRRLAEKGALIVFCPSYLLSHPRTAAVLEKIPQVRAFDAMAYFVMVDAFTPETFRQTRICHPLKEIASLTKEGMVLAQLDPSEIRSLRDQFRNNRWRRQGSAGD